MFKKTIPVLLAIGFLLMVGIAAAQSERGGPGNGGSGDIPDTGDLYGDLYVILRDVNGAPILGPNGCIQPISSMDGSTTLPDGTEVVVVAGEPFELATYTDSEGVLIECELTETMAAWVQGVDFGRLDLGRAPEGVIAHAFDEAINKMNAATGFSIDPAGRIMYTVDGESFSTIDAPAENLALYIKMMKDGHWITLDTAPVEPGDKGKKGSGSGPPPGDGPSTEERPVLSDQAIALLDGIGYGNLGDVDNDLNSHDLLLAASLLAGAADKSGTMTLDQVVYINSIYGINQLGTIIDAKGNKYVDFGVFEYSRSQAYANRGTPGCEQSSSVWVLQPVTETTFETTCMDLLGYDPVSNPDYNSVHFVDKTEIYETEGLTDYEVFDSNIRGFAQAADDALQALEYIHNYKIPTVLYPASESALSGSSMQRF